MSSTADLERAVIRAARSISRTSPVIYHDLVSASCPYCDGSHEQGAGFIHDADCKWMTLAEAVATLNVNTRVKGASK